MDRVAPEISQCVDGEGWLMTTACAAIAAAILLADLLLLGMI